MAIEGKGEHMRFNKLRIRLSAISSFFALALGASTFGPASVAAQQQAVLGGVISDAVTGKIVDAAAVTLVGTGIETRTAADGIFEFPDAPLGPVTIRVEAPGYPAVVEEVEMTPGTVRIMQVILHSADAVLRDILGVVPATDAARRGDARSAADLLARKVLGTTATGGNIGGSAHNTTLGVDITGATPFWRFGIDLDFEALKAEAAEWARW